MFNKIKFEQVKARLSLEEAVDLHTDLSRAIDEVMDHNMEFIAKTGNERIVFTVYPSPKQFCDGSIR